MKIPTHIVVDMQDGWVFAKDHNGNLFTEHTAKSFVDTRNDEMKDEHRTYIMATVTPQRSPEYLTALAQTAGDRSVAMIEDVEVRGD